MPTWDQLDGFRRELRNLTPEQRAAFIVAVTHFVADLKMKKFRKGLRVKKVQGTRDVWEMTWADNGRATFHYGESIHHGEQHVVWRRIGTHDVFDRP